MSGVNKDKGNVLLNKKAPQLNFYGAFKIYSFYSLLLAQ